MQSRVAGSSPHPPESSNVNSAVACIQPSSGSCIRPTTYISLNNMLLVAVFFSIIVILSLSYLSKHRNNPQDRQSGEDSAAVHFAYQASEESHPENLYVGGVINRGTNALGSNWSVPFFYSAPFHEIYDGDFDSARDGSKKGAADSPPFRDLWRAMETYRSDVASALFVLGKAESIARASELALGLEKAAAARGGAHASIAASLRERRGKLAEIFEKDGFVLQGLLQPFPVTKGLPVGQGSYLSPTKKLEDIYYSVDEELRCESPEKVTSVPPSKEWILKYRDSSLFGGEGDEEDRRRKSYDSAASVLAHLVRDWSDEGAAIRTSIYDWVVDRIQVHRALVMESSLSSSSTQSSCDNVVSWKVLVPGAGLARLALDILYSGFVVEANDLSLVTAACAHKILHGKARGVVHPFASDSFTNEVDSRLRYEEVQFPDKQTLSAPPSVAVPRLVQADGYPRSMSYTVGDFVETYASPERRRRYFAVVTCFFLDTATSVYEYIATIRNALTLHGGVWINVGPLQWHRNAMVNPSADELRRVIEAMGFNITYWQVDKEVVNYRHAGDGVTARSTRFEGYRPLRFVAVRRGARKEGASEYCYRGGGRGNNVLHDTIRKMREAIQATALFTVGEN